MANIKSQIKRNRQTIKAEERNKAIRSRVKTYLKRYDTALATGDADAAKAAFVDAQRELDKAVSKGVMHANTASRKKGRLAKRLQNV